MNKKFFAGVMALSLMISGVLCGCNADKDTESDEKSSSSSSKSKSVSTDNEKEESSAKDASLTDKIYTDYLSQQKLCKISKNFKILEAGTARDNPNGLAGAVKHDFDGDKVDELVTFTFEKNSTNGEDIRIDLLKIDDGKAVLSDNKYLTDILDMDFLYPYQKGNTIYYSDLSELQIVQSEYNGQLYFGVLLKEADYLGGLSSFNTKYSVFTIKDNKIESEAVGAVINDAVFNISYARQIPPSISDMELSDTACIIDDKISQSPEMAEQEKKRIDEMTVDQEKYNLFTDSHSFDGSYQIKGGAYESKSQAFSAMLNEFGLDIDDAYNQNHYNFVSKNQSEIKMIIQMEQLRPFDGSGVMEYLGTKLTLDSDLEELLGNDSPFREPFADELALYEDILKYPYYYHEIWDTYAQLSNGSLLIGFNYCIADINRDDKYELIITSYADSDQLPLHCSVIMPDLTTIDIDGQGETRFLDNGIVSVTEVGGAMSPVHYYDINTNISWTANDVRQEDMKYIRSIWQDNGDICLEGAEAEKKEQELSNGSLLMLNEVFYNLYSDNFSELIIVEDINEITYTWQKAYLSAIDEFKVVGNAPYGTEYEYALLYIDDDEIPELYIIDRATGIGGLYTYYNGEAMLVSQAGSARANAFYGYIKNKGIFVTYNNGGVYYWSNEINQLSNGCASITKNFNCIDEEYYIDDTKVTGKEFEDSFAKYSDQFTEITYCSEFKIKRSLKGISETWQNAYIEQINENQFKSEMEYALVYIDNDDIPELVIGDACDHRCGGLYTYVNDDISELTYLTLRYCIDGYIEKKGIFGICHWWSPSGEEGYDIFQIESGTATQTDAFLKKYTDEKDVYTINEKEVSESEYQSAYEKRSAQFVEVTYCTYDEIIKKLNADL